MTRIFLFFISGSKMREENETLKKRLLLYENPHTPPSLQRFKSKTDKTTGKRGAPIGHKGAVQPITIPDQLRKE